MKRILSFVITLTMIAGVLASFVSADGSPFSDVSTTRWSYKSIIYAFENGLMDGVGGGKFNPSGTMTRGMVVTVLYRMEKSPDVTFTNEFSDVPEGKYYSDAVIWAKNNEIVNGVGDGKFNPGGQITREQLAAMLYRYAEFCGFDTRIKGSISKFPDESEVHGYAVDSLIWATSKGLITGVKSGSKDLLNPRGNATREQFATILERFGKSDLSYPVEYNEPVIMNSYTEKEYPLVTDADIYVATDGNDSAAGDFEHPFATFERAVDEVRSLRAGGKEGVVVAFKAGVYFTDTVNMDEDVSGAKDNPVVYCAYGDGEVIITGGTVIQESEFTGLTDEEKGWFQDKAAKNIKKASLKGKLASYSTRNDILFSESGVVDVARYPNKDNGKDVLFSAGFTPDANHIRINQQLFTRRIAKYHTLEGLQLYGLLTTGWYKDTLDTAGYDPDPETNGYDFIIPDPSQARMGHLRYLELEGDEFDSKAYNSTAILNISEELDTAGEYWVDQNTMNMYVYDPSGTYTFPSVDRGINMHYCDYVTFRGLTMTSYKEHVVKALECSGITFDLCKITACAGNEAVYIDGNHGDLDYDLTVTDCEFSVLAEKGLRANGYCWGGNKFDHRGNVLFDNNRVSLSHLVHDGGCAIEIEFANEAVVSHNEFVDCGSGALGYGGNCNIIIEYNTFKHCMFNSQDGGVLYSWNRQYDWGNVIRYNVIYPAAKWYGVYIDDAEPGTEIYSNIFYNVGAAVCIHNGRSNFVHDNVMINSSVAYAVGDMTYLLDEYKTTGDASLITGNDFYKEWVSLFNELDSKPALKNEYFTRYPEFASLTADLDKIDDPSFVLYPRNYVQNNYYFSSKGADDNNDHECSVVEGNRFFSLEENPCFVNPAIGDYRIVEGSEFPDIYFERIGRY